MGIQRERKGFRVRIRERAGHRVGIRERKGFRVVIGDRKGFRVGSRFPGASIVISPPFSPCQFPSVQRGVGSFLRFIEEWVEFIYLTYRICAGFLWLVLG